MEVGLLLTMVAAVALAPGVGAQRAGLPQPRGQLMRWDEVPPLSEDFARADEAIRKRVAELIEELMHR